MRKQRTTTNNNRNPDEIMIQFGKEVVVLKSQSYRSFSLTHLLSVTLFGPNYSLILPEEIVHQTREAIVFHIASYDR